MSSCTCGHEFIGTVVALGASFHNNEIGRPVLYATLKRGDKVLAPFTVTCGECRCVFQLIDSETVFDVDLGFAGWVSPAGASTRPCLAHRLFPEDKRSSSAFPKPAVP